MKSIVIDGVPIPVHEKSRAAFVLEDLSEQLPKTRESIQYLIEYMSGIKFEADPYVNVNDLLPVLKLMRVQLSPRFPEVK